MIAGGTGGAHTITGKYFEVETDLKTALTEAGYNLSDFFFCRQHDFPKYFKEITGVKMEDIFGKKYLPDEAVIFNNVLYIIEKKKQSGGGSVDEKIQTGFYKLLIYQECAKMLGLADAKYIYLLSGEYFNVPKFTKHQIPTLAASGIPTYFDKLPLENLF
jgi:hypothetical protein